MQKLWGERSIWPEHRSVSIPETAWSNRERSQTKHLWTSVWHREAELQACRDHTAHSQHIDPTHSAMYSTAEAPNLFWLSTLSKWSKVCLEPLITGCIMTQCRPVELKSQIFVFLFFNRLKEIKQYIITLLFMRNRDKMYGKSTKESILCSSYCFFIIPSCRTTSASIPFEGSWPAGWEPKLYKPCN